MKRILALLIFLLPPLAVFADGMVTPTIAFPANVTIPDQRALICFSNGVERLVIETRFSGMGTNFAWVVPLPNKPVIEEATTGVFPTLQSIFEPRLIHEVPEHFVWLLSGILFIVLLRQAVKSVFHAFRLAVMLLLVIFIFLPVFFPARSKSGFSSATSAKEVSILDRKIVGVFDTAVITSRDAKSLQSWLSENGFVVPTNSQPVIEAYLKEGWVFATAKVSRHDSDGETNTLHPLSFVFNTERPVYPMRLTGLGNAPLTVELYYFGNETATARHFKVESRLRPKIAHPLLRQWIPESSAGTKLTAQLSPSQMQQDVWLHPAPMIGTRAAVVFSRHGALITALNWGAGIFAAGLVAIYILWRRQPAKIPRLLGALILTAGALLIMLYVSFPKTEIKLVNGFPKSIFKQQQLTVQMILADAAPKTLAEARHVVQTTIADPKKSEPYYFRNMWDNVWLGGQIHEEDSPGNYLLRTNNTGQLELIGFDQNGEERLVTTFDLTAPFAATAL